MVGCGISAEDTVYRLEHAASTKHPPKFEMSRVCFLRLNRPAAPYHWVPPETASALFLSRV